MRVWVVVLAVLVLVLPCTQAWWFWGGEEEQEAADAAVDPVAAPEAVEVKTDAVEDIVETVKQDKVEAELDPDDVEDDFFMEAPAEMKTKVTEKPDIFVKLANTGEVINIQQGHPGIQILEDEAEFDKIMEQYNSIVHTDQHGHHNDEYDHQAFLGAEEAETFKHLTPEESKERLSGILEKIDENKDTLISVPELTKWIKKTGVESVQRRTALYWKRSNPEGNKELSWDEYRARQYGFLSDIREANSEGRWVKEDDVDQSTLQIYRSLELRDRRRWTVADRNKNLMLDEAEFLGFLHPEAELHMVDILVTETLADLDKDGDGKLNLKEYVINVFGDDLKAEDWEQGGIQFRQFRDKNKDGVLDKKELQEWLLPSDYDQNQAEAEHLIYESDRDGDKLLSRQEALDRYSMFVASQATNFGEDLHIRHHDEL